jgi:hypothetical protein
MILEIKQNRQMTKRLTKIDIEAYQRLKILDGMGSVYFKGKIYTKNDLIRIGELINKKKE